MFRLISEKCVLPRSLFLTDVKTEVDPVLSATDKEGLGNVFQGEHGGQQVVLKEVCWDQKKVSAMPFFLENAYLLYKGMVRRDLCRRAVAWVSLAHRFILPVLGVFEEKTHLFLVTPHMINGTLSQWRRNMSPLDLSEIHRLVGFKTSVIVTIMTVIC
jgi:hypothetical protein